MDLQTVALIVFLALMFLFLYSKRKDIEIQKILPFYLLYFVMYRTKWGLRFMNSFREMSRAHCTSFPMAM